MYFLYNYSLSPDYSKCTYLAWTHEQHINHTHMRGSIAHAAGIRLKVVTTNALTMIQFSGSENTVLKLFMHVHQ